MPCKYCKTIIHYRKVSVTSYPDEDYFQIAYYTDNDTDDTKYAIYVDATGDSWIDSSPVLVDIKFCPYCGRKLEVQDAD